MLALATDMARVSLPVARGGFSPRSAEARLTVGPEHLNPHGAVHGAVLFAMVDTAMGAATMSVLPEGRLCASIDVQMRFLAPVFDGSLAATAEVIKAGKKVVHLQARVLDHDDRVVAFGTGAFSVFDAP